MNTFADIAILVFGILRFVNSTPFSILKNAIENVLFVPQKK